MHSLTPKKAVDMFKSLSENQEMSAKEETRGRRRKATENSSPGPTRKLRSRLKPEPTEEKLKAVENKPGSKSSNMCTDPEKQTTSKYFHETNDASTPNAVPSTSSNFTPEKDDIFSQILKSKRTISFSNVNRAVFPLAGRSSNITHCLDQASIGSRFSSTQKQVREWNIRANNY